MDDHFYRQIKKYITHRAWQHIVDDWLNYLPDLDTAGSAPDIDLDDFYLLQSAIKKQSSVDSFKDELDKLRAYTFHEGLFLLHKATHVVGASEIHAQQGMTTWSISSAYQGTLFGAKAIMHLLGIAITSQDNNNWIIDCYTERQKLTSKEKKLGLKPLPTTLFFKTGLRRIEHRHIWAIFQRIMRVTKFSGDSIEMICDSLSSSSFDVLDFAKQRNMLHYDNHVWFFNDMFEYVVKNEFGFRDQFTSEDFRYQRPDSDFSMVIALSIIHFGITLLTEIAAKTHKLDDELDLVRKIVCPERHPILSRINF